MLNFDATTNHTWASLCTSPCVHHMWTIHWCCTDPRHCGQLTVSNMSREISRAVQGKLGVRNMTQMHELE